MYFTATPILTITLIPMVMLYTGVRETRAASQSGISNGTVSSSGDFNGPMSTNASSGGPMPGMSGGSIGGGMPMMPMGPSVPNAIHHVGIGYNLLTGNPDGEYWSTGGEDPGVHLTRKVFTISPVDVPPEVIVEHHDGCQYSHGFFLFYNLKSYQDKLFTRVKTQGTADATLNPYAFSLSSAYQAVAQQTSRHHYVFQEATTYCLMGNVRYSMNLATVDKYPVTRDFASAVCALPVTYDSGTYMNFIDTWGTHVMTEAVIGKVTTNRYVGRLRDIFNFVMFNVTDELSTGGPLYGYNESYVIDVNTFQYKHEYRYIVGVFEDQLTIGDLYFNDVIVELLAMPVTWPLGTYSLPKPNSDCPVGFMEGSLDLRHTIHTPWSQTISHLDGQLSLNHYTLKFCTKEDPSPTEFDIYWPMGDYCMLQYDNMCPYAFNSGRLKLRVVSASTSGAVPTGTYGTTTEMQFCCRNDTVYSQKMYLPNDRPFYLFRNQHGCQQIYGMTATEETVTFYNDINAGGNANQTSLSGSHPYIETVGQTSHGASQYILHYCYYQTNSK